MLDNMCQRHPTYKHPIILLYPAKTSFKHIHTTFLKYTSMALAYIHLSNSLYIHLIHTSHPPHKHGLLTSTVGDGVVSASMRRGADGINAINAMV